jgi:uncharacterized protein with FMN-binding domain
VADGPNRKIANGLVALSSAAVLAVYGAGYERTRAAADRYAAHGTDRRPRRPAAPARPSMTAVPAAAGVEEKAAPVVAPASSDRRGAASERSSKPVPVETVARAEPTAATPQPKPARSGKEDAPVTPVAESPTVGSPAAAEPVPPPTAPAVAAAPSDQAAYRDGTYLGWGSCRHGDIQASVVVENGRIASAAVAQCLTRYSCAWINPLPPQIVKQQGTTFDYVSGATESSDAFQDAVADALSHAQ